MIDCACDSKQIQRVSHHLIPTKEGKTTLLISKSMKRVVIGTPRPSLFLQVCHRKHPDLLHYRLVRNCSVSKRKVWGLPVHYSVMPLKTQSTVQGRSVRNPYTPPMNCIYSTHLDGNGASGPSWSVLMNCYFQQIILFHIIAVLSLHLVTVQKR